MDPVCPKCKNPLSPSYFYCPYCGKQVRKKPLSTSVGKQISVYLISVFLPPFGLVPGFQYLVQPDAKSKIVGVMALLLTAISLMVTTYYTIEFVNQFNKILSSQLTIQGLGY